MKNRPDPRLARLAAVADLLLQNELDRLAREAAALRSARIAFDALEPGHVDPSDPSLIEAQLRHQKWAAACRKNLEADIRQRELSVALHRQSAARSLARGRVIEVLGRRTPLDHPS